MSACASFDPEVRAAEKQLDRDRAQERIAAGEISADDYYRSVALLGGAREAGVEMSIDLSQVGPLH